MAKLPNFVVRVLAGSLFVALLLGGILFNRYCFGVLFAVLTGLALYEFYTLMIADNKKLPISNLLGIIAGIVLFLSAYAYTFYHIIALVAIYILLILGISIGELYLKRDNPIRSLAYIMLGQLYIAAPLALTNYLVNIGDKGFDSVYLLAILVLIWVNDSFAYLTGMAFGKHRLFERISPKKSWEGFIGGAVFAVIASLIFYHFSADQLGLIGWIGFALIIVAFGTWGDLIESLIKRTLKVKDSGNMIPGHGGILDRMDSTILAIPAAAAYLMLIETFNQCV